MDPDKALRGLVALSRRIVDGESDEGENDAQALAHGLLDLTEWMARSGFSPDWKAALREDN